MQIYLARNNVQAGPYTLEQLNTMLISGEVILDDLAWHKGMSQWKRLGDLTNNQYHYQPDFIQKPINQQTQINNTNITTHQSKPIHKDNQYPQQNNQKISTKIASVSSRVLAVTINLTIFMLCLFPLLSHVGIDELQKGPMTPERANLIVESMPENIVMLNFFLIIGFIIIQLILMLKRGQSIGKFLAGIQVIDYKSHKLPSSHILLFRAISTIIIYYLLPIGILFMFIDFIVLANQKEHRSLHDRFFNTYVVKVDKKQSDKVE